jgi:hypothetical protein
MTKIEGEWRYWDVCLKMPYPWYTKPCVQWIDSLDLTERSIFEFGVGESTKWYLERGAFVHGVETNHDWWLKAVNAGAEVQLISNPAEYATACYSEFDIIVVDGINRDECVFESLYHLKQGGFMIIDNYMQPSVEMNWPKTKKIVEDIYAAGPSSITIFKEPDHYDWQTLVIRKTFP